MESKKIELIEFKYSNDAMKDLYDKIIKKVWKYTSHNVYDKMSGNPEVKKLEEIVNENNKTYFNLNQALDPYDRDKYKDDIENFDKNIEKLYEEKKQLQNKFVFGKKKKLNLIDQEIHNMEFSHEQFLKIFEKEKAFKEKWYKNGEFVDINKDYNSRLKEIKNEYIKENVVKMFEENPEFLMYDFKQSEIPKEAVDIIKDYQKSKEIELKNKSKNEKDSLEVEPEKE